MATYPDTQLRSDPPQQDPDYGGESANSYGALAFSWINSVLQFLEDAYLKVTRQAYATVFVNVQDAVAAGDVLCIFPDSALTNTRYYVKRYASGTNRRVYAIALEPGSADSVVRAAIFGIIPASVTGIAGGVGSSSDVGLNVSTGRLRVAVAGDVILGRTDTQGNVLFTGYGASVP